MPRLAGAVSGATASTVATASSHRPRENSARASCSAARLRWTRLASRSPASIACRPAVTASSKRPKRSERDGDVPQRSRDIGRRVAFPDLQRRLKQRNCFDGSSQLDQGAGAKVECQAEFLVRAGLLGGLSSFGGGEFCGLGLPVRVQDPGERSGGVGERSVTLVPQGLVDLAQGHDQLRGRAAPLVHE